METRSNRRLAAILAADVVGFSRLVGADEEDTIGALRRIRAEIVEPVIAGFDGRIANTAGDSFLIEFRSAVDAVQAALGIQSGLKDWNNGRAADRAILMRIGVNVGDVMSNGDDILGDGVNIAARLEALAAPGGIVTSRAVADYARGKVGARFVSMGPQQVKNIADPVEAFRVESGEGAAPATTSKRATGRRVIAAALAIAVMATVAAFWAWPRIAGEDAETLPRASEERMAFPLPDRPSVAVLPFSNRSGAADDNVLVDGLTEDLITDLASISGLFVIAGNSSLSYRDQRADIAGFAEEMGVRYIADGSLRRGADALHINARLIDATSGQLVWADRFEGAAEDIFEMQNRIVSQMVEALELPLSEEERAGINRLETEKVEAREAFQEGWMLYSRFNEADNLAAIPHFERAIALDPDYGRAWAALAMSHLRPHIFHHWNAFVAGENRLHIGRFYEVLKRASEFETSMIHVVRAMQILSLTDTHTEQNESRGAEAARVEAARAIALQPNNPEAHLIMGWALITAGSAGDGLRFVETAMRLDPLHPSHYILYKAAAHFAMDDLAGAEATLLEGLQKNPKATELMPVAAAMLALGGKRREGRAMVDRWRAGQSEATLNADVSEYTFVVQWAGKNQALNTKLLDGLRLASLPRETTVTGLVADLSLGAATARRKAARALGLFGEEAAPAVPDLIAALDDPSSFVRKEAAIALGRIGPPARSAIPALTARTGDSLVGAFARRALERIGAISAD